MSEVYRLSSRPPGWGVRLLFVIVSLLLGLTIASVVKDLLPDTLSTGTRVLLPGAVLAVALYVGQEWTYRSVTVRHVPVCPHCRLDLDSPARTCRHCGGDTWDG